METLSSVACKLYEYLYFAIVFRLSVEERVKRNWASSLSLIIAYFIFFLFFVYSRVLLSCVFLQNRSILDGREGDCISKITKKIDIRRHKNSEDTKRM